MYYYTQLGNRYTIDDMVPDKTILNMIRDILDNGVDVYSSILDKKIDDNHTWIEQTNVRISEEVGTINDRITAEVDTLNNSLNNAVTQLKDTITANDLKHTTAENNLSDRISANSTRIDQTNERISNEVDTINDHISDEVSDINTSINALNMNLSGLTTRVNTIQSSTESNTSSIANINDSVSALQTKLYNLDNNNPNNVASGSRSTLQSYLVNANAAPDSVTAKSGLQNWVITKNNAVNTELNSLDSRIQALEEGGGGQPSTQSHSMMWNFISSSARSAFINMDSSTYYYLPTGANGTENHAGYALIKTSDTTLRIIVTDYMANTMSPTTTIINNVLPSPLTGDRVSVTASPYYLTLPTAIPLDIDTNLATLYAPFPPFMTAISNTSWLPEAYHYLGSGMLNRNLTGEITPARCLFYVAQNTDNANNYGILIPSGDGFVIGPKNVTIPF